MVAQTVSMKKVLFQYLDMNNYSFNVFIVSGIAYYKDLITKLRENNIEPIVTMHHWDQPTALENEGGFLNEVLILSL